MGSTWGEGFWCGWFCVVNWGLVAWVQGARREALGECKILANCELDSLGMLAWVVVLDWVRV